MDAHVDTGTLDQLQKDLRSVGRSLDRRTVSPALLRASQPALNAVKAEAPVGHDGNERVSLSRGRGRHNNYRRGGATRNDVRLKSVDGVGSEVTRVLVGVSKKSGRVGWRTRFLTLGTKKMRANPFIDRGVSRSIDEVRTIFLDLVSGIVKRILRRASK